MFNYNEEIETTLSELGVPVSFMFYEGNADAFVTRETRNFITKQFV